MIRLAALLAVPLAAQQPDIAALEKAYEAEVRARPSATAWEKLGLARHLQNRFDLAIEAFDNAIKLSPQRPNSYLFLGIACYRTNQFERGLTALDNADRLAPATGKGRDETDYWLAATRIAARKPLAGLAVLERLLARSPRHPEAMPLAIRTYASMAETLWNGVAERHFSSPAGQLVHGHALEAEGDAAGALAAFAAARRLAPRTPGAGTGMARVLLGQGKRQEAEAALVGETGPEAAYLRGLTAMAAGRHAEALSPLEHAAQWPRRAPEAPLALAQVLLALNRPQDALRAAKLALELDPTSAAARQAHAAALARL